MKRLIILFSSLLLLRILILFDAQSQGVNLPPVVSPSPDAAALGKYGNVPVGLYTGIPDINIPLYTIKTRKLELPISLSYHSGGFKVSEIASWIGLGWSLNAGGVISRTVVGRPDDESDGFWSRNDIKSSQYIRDSDFYYLKSIADGSRDGESDYYFYNFNGHSGQFVYYQNNNQTPFLIPKVPIQINYTSGHFEIIDEMGNIYKFSDIETLDFRGPNLIQFDFASSYYLSEIISADGSDSINFSYIRDFPYGETNPSYTETIGKLCPGNNSFHTFTPLSEYRMITPLILKEINFANGKIEFIKDNTARLDNPESRLDTIKISEKNTNGSFDILKKIVLGKGYFITPPANTKDLYRLKLTGITEKDAKDKSVKKYSFLYNETTLLPNRTSSSQDWWGFYNGRNNSSLIESEDIFYEGVQYHIGAANRDPDSTSMKACILKTIFYPTGGYTVLDYEPNYYGPGNGIMAGGLRVKKICDYEAPGKTPITKIYKYGTPSLKGILEVPAEALSCSKQEADFTYHSQSCVVTCVGKRMTITGRPVYNLTSLNGAIVVYPDVIVYDKDSTSAPNGRQVFKFNVDVNGSQGVDKAYYNGRFELNNNTWKGGDETYNSIYRGNTDFKGEKNLNSYSVYQETFATGTKVGYKMTHEGLCVQNAETINDFYYFDYPIWSGIKKLTSTTKRTYSFTNSDSIDTQFNYSYDNLNDHHQQLTKKTLINSSGDTIKTKYWYPADYDSSISDSLLNKNIIAIPIKEENYKNNKITAGKVTQYDNSGHPKEIYLYETTQPQPSPIHDPDSLIPSHYVKRASMTYDSNQNLQYVQLTDNIMTSYIWGYGNTLPIAEVKNASPDKVAYTSFEAYNEGSWNYSLGTITTSNTAKTGSKYFTFSGSNVISRNLSPGSYIVEYWAKSAVSVSGDTVTDISTSSPDANGWIFYKKNVIINANSQLNFSSGSPTSIDELRLYTADALMTTYSYDPLIGMTSRTDENNVTTYYEYDSFGRLQIIRDKDYNILKTYSYHYKK